MHHPSRRVRFALVAIQLVVLLLSGCGAPPAIVYVTATPQPLPPGTPTPAGDGIVTGEITFPPTGITARDSNVIDLFFENISTTEVVTVPIPLHQASFTLSLPAGIYTAYTATSSAGQQGGHTVCQTAGSCVDHTLQPFVVVPGETTTGIDIFDWYVPEGPPLALLGTLIDGTGSPPLQDGVIVIQNERIIAVGAQSEVAIPADAEIIALPDATILPGFINSHVHEATLQANSIRWAQEGVTTVRDVGAPLGEPYFFMRDRRNADPQFARIVAAGPLVTVPGGYPIVPNGFDSLTVTSPDDARRKIDELIDSGAEVIKITFALGGYPTLSLEEATAIVETAHARGVPVAAHIASYRDLQRALDAGVDDVSHMVHGGVPDPTIRQMVEGGVFWIPTFEVADGWGVEDLRRFIAAGGQVAMGDDSGYLLEVGMPMHEFYWMEQAGMTPMDIIVASTRNGARVCRLEEELGTLEVGKIADVLVVQGNPLEDMDALRDVLMVIHRGIMIRSEGYEN